MIEQDTIKLLRECDAGIKMGVTSIDDVLDNVKDPEFRKCLTTCKREHEELKEENRPYWTPITTMAKTPIPWLRVCPG